MTRLFWISTFLSILLLPAEVSAQTKNLLEARCPDCRADLTAANPSHRIGCKGYRRPATLKEVKCSRCGLWSGGPAGLECSCESRRRREAEDAIDRAKDRAEEAARAVERQAEEAARAVKRQAEEAESQAYWAGIEAKRQAEKAAREAKRQADAEALMKGIEALAPEPDGETSDLRDLWPSLAKPANSSRSTDRSRSRRSEVCDQGERYEESSDECVTPGRLSGSPYEPIPVDENGYANPRDFGIRRGRKLNFDAKLTKLTGNVRHPDETPRWAGSNVLPHVQIPACIPFAGPDGDLDLTATAAYAHDVLLELDGVSAMGGSKQAQSHHDYLLKVLDGSNWTVSSGIQIAKSIGAINSLISPPSNLSVQDLDYLLAGSGNAGSFRGIRTNDSSPGATPAGTTVKLENLDRLLTDKVPTEPRKDFSSLDRLLSP